MLSSKHLSHKLIFHVLQYYNDNNNLTSHILPMCLCPARVVMMVNTKRVECLVYYKNSYKYNKPHDNSKITNKTFRNTHHLSYNSIVTEPI